MRPSSSLIVCCVSSISAGIMDDFAWRPLVKQVGLVDGDVPPPLVSVNEPSKGGGDSIEARLTHPGLLMLSRLHLVCLFLQLPRGNAVKRLEQPDYARSQRLPLFFEPLASHRVGVWLESFLFPSSQDSQPTKSNADPLSRSDYCCYS